MVVPVSPRSAAGPFGQPGDDRPRPAPPDESGGGLDLRLHAAGIERTGGDHAFGLLHAHAPDGARLRCAPALENRIHVGQDHQHFGLQLTGEDGGDPVLVHYGVEPLETENGVLIHRRPATARGDDQRAQVEQSLDERKLDYAER